ncbi:MAG TPA: hypothetical protein VFJ06_04655 [Halococcus sp.]|nr:hypothetical protein [Halococcus sp.]
MATATEQQANGQHGFNPRMITESASFGGLMGRARCIQHIPSEMSDCSTERQNQADTTPYRGTTTMDGNDTTEGGGGW